MANETELLQKMVDSSNVTFYLKDEQGRYIMVNRHAADRFYLKVDDFVGKTVYDFLPKEEADYIRSKELKTVEAGIPMHFKFNITTRKGMLAIINELFPVTLEGYPNAVGGISMEVNDIEE